jgi:hypothetical protein
VQIAQLTRDKKHLELEVGRLQERLEEMEAERKDVKKRLHEVRTLDRSSDRQTKAKLLLREMQLEKINRKIELMEKRLSKLPRGQGYLALCHDEDSPRAMAEMKAELRRNILQLSKQVAWWRERIRKRLSEHTRTEVRVQVPTVLAQPVSPIPQAVSSLNPLWALASSKFTSSADQGVRFICTQQLSPVQSDTKAENPVKITRQTVYETRGTQLSHIAASNISIQRGLIAQNTFLRPLGYPSKRIAPLLGFSHSPSASLPMVSGGAVLLNK